MVLGTSTVRARLTMVRSPRPLLNVTAIQGSQSWHPGRQEHSLGLEHSYAGEHGSSVQDIQGHRHHPSILRLLEKSAPNPVIKSSHRGSAPDLVIHASRRLPHIGPVRGLAEIPAEDQCHLVLRISLPALDLAGV